MIRYVVIAVLVLSLAVVHRWLVYELLEGGV